mgnify:CR=1 FL=1
MVMNTLSDEEKDFIWTVFRLLSGHTSPRKTKKKSFIQRWKICIKTKQKWRITK